MRKYSQRVASWDEAMVWRVDGSAWVRLLDVTRLDKGTVATSWSEREGQSAIRGNTCAFSTGNGQMTPRAIKTSWLCTLSDTHTHMHRKTEDKHGTRHSLTMKNDTVERLVAFKLWNPLRPCCCRLVCTYKAYTHTWPQLHTHTHTHIWVERNTTLSTMWAWGIDWKVRVNSTWLNFNRATLTVTGSVFIRFCW